MALTAEQERKCYLYLGVQQVARVGDFVGGVPVTTPTVHRLQAALDNLTAAGETSVGELLTVLDGLWAKLNTVEKRFQASKVGSIELNPKEWDDRQRQWAFWAGKLDALLFPTGDGVLAGTSSLQGPYGEP